MTVARPFVRTLFLFTTITYVELPLCVPLSLSCPENQTPPVISAVLPRRSCLGPLSLLEQQNSLSFFRVTTSTPHLLPLHHLPVSPSSSVQKSQDTRCTQPSTTSQRSSPRLNTKSVPSRETSVTSAGHVSAAPEPGPTSVVPTSYTTCGIST